jgi:hypothetical protein
MECTLKLDFLWMEVYLAGWKAGSEGERSMAGENGGDFLLSLSASLSRVRFALDKGEEGQLFFEFDWYPQLLLF